jgi:hypothetical protein
MTDDGSGTTRNVFGGGASQGPVLQGRNFRGVHIGDVVQAAAAPVARAQLPAPVAGFTGRDRELAQVTALLDPAAAAGAVVVSAVAGLAGVERRRWRSRRPMPPARLAGLPAEHCSLTCMAMTMRR